MRCHHTCQFCFSKLHFVCNFSTWYIFNLHYWKINKSPKHLTDLTRLGNTTFLVSHKKLSPILRKGTDQNQQHLAVTSNTRRARSPLFVLLSSFTWPHNYTRNEAYLLPATLPHRHMVFRVVQPIHRTAEEPALGRGFPKHPPHPMEGQALCRPCTAVPSYHRSPSSMPQATKDDTGQGIFTFSNRINPTECQLMKLHSFPAWHISGVHQLPLSVFPAHAGHLHPTSFQNALKGMCVC